MLDTKMIGEHIKELRQEMGLTQSELAEILSVRFQAVSNWERGITSPDIENLLKIAEYFKVTVDEILRKRQDGLYLGIDGGGTKTEFVVTDEDGYLIRRVLKNGSNPNDIGYLAMSQLILDTIGDLIVEFPSIKSVFCGISGLSTGNNATRLVCDIKKRYPKLLCDAKTDAYNIFAIDESAEMIVISGTGSVVFVRNGEQLSRLGGFGYLLDSAGSAYDIGRDAIAAALSEEDRAEPSSILTRAVKEKLGADTVWEGIGTIYKGGKPYIAEFSSVVFTAYEKGDKTAINIVDKSAKALSELLNLGIKRYGVKAEALARGGIFDHHADIMLKHISKYSNVKIKVVGLPPVYGAVRLARSMDGEICDDFGKNFESSYGGHKK